MKKRSILVYCVILRLQIKAIWKYTKILFIKVWNVHVQFVAMNLNYSLLLTIFRLNIKKRNISVILAIRSIEAEDPSSDIQKQAMKVSYLIVLFAHPNSQVTVPLQFTLSQYILKKCFNVTFVIFKQHRRVVYLNILKMFIIKVKTLFALNATKLFRRDIYQVTLNCFIQEVKLNLIVIFAHFKLFILVVWKDMLKMSTKSFFFKTIYHNQCLVLIKT